MFEVRLFRLACACEELQQAADRRRFEIQNIDEVIGALQSLSGMEEVLGPLKQKREELETQQVSLQELVQSLEELRIRYERAEGRVCGNANAYP